MTHNLRSNKKQKISETEIPLDGGDDVKSVDSGVEELLEKMYDDMKKYKIPKKIFLTSMKNRLIEFEKETLKNLNTHCQDNLQQDTRDDAWWAFNLSEKQVKDIEPIYHVIEQTEKDKSPTFLKIINANISEAERKKYLQMFKTMTTLNEGSAEYFEIYNELVSVLEKVGNIDRGSIRDLDQKEKDILEKIKSNDNSLRNKILSLDCNDDTKSIIYEKYLHLQKMSVGEEYDKIKNQIEICIRLPFNTVALCETNLSVVSQKLDKHLYALKDVKTELLTLLSKSLTNPNASKCIALCGVAGSGKTSIAQAFAQAVGLPFDHISLGGAKDSSLFYGSNGVYIGGKNGMIVEILKKMKCSNGVLLFDEVDKLAETPEGREMQYALLNIADYSQNKQFRDKYLDGIDIDISRMWFFYAMNNKHVIDKALLSRLPIIDVDPFTYKEKLVILRDYTLQKCLKNLGIASSDVVLSKEVYTKIIEHSTESEGGLRRANEIIEKIVSRINFWKENNAKGIICEVDFTIKNFKLPLTVDIETFEELNIIGKNVQVLSYFN